MSRAALALVILALAAPAVAQVQPGVGLSILPGALSCWTASPSQPASGCAPMNMGCRPYDPTGTVVVDAAAFACRYGTRMTLG